MKVLLVSHLRRKVTPDVTASRPRFIFDLATQLINHGHEVDLLGTGDSHIPGATIIPVIPEALFELPPFENPFYAELSYMMQMLHMLKKISPEYDVIHNHAFPEFFNLLIANQIKTPMITTIHAPVTPELDKALALFPDTYLVSPSISQKGKLQKSKISAVIPHGTDTGLYSFSAVSSDYLLWIGRLGKAKDDHGQFIDGKGVRIAIEVAKASRKKLLMTGNVEDREFFDRDVKPHLSDQIQWLGGVSAEQPLAKNDIAALMQKAKGLLITTRFDEAFGLTAIEAMSCGTPVIGVNKGAVPEIVKNGVTGFIISAAENDVITALSDAIAKLYVMPSEEYTNMRNSCRERIEQNYSLEKMAENYIAFYLQCVEKLSA